MADALVRGAAGSLEWTVRRWLVCSGSFSGAQRPDTTVIKFKHEWNLATMSQNFEENVLFPLPAFFFFF